MITRETEVITIDRLLRRVRLHTFDLAAVAHQGFVQFEKRKPTCRTGCSFCCYQKVLIDAATGAMIYLYLVAEGRWSPGLEARLLAADREIAPVAHHNWLPLKRPCVFLKEKAFGLGTCTIYPVRPVNCALAFSKVDDPSQCAEPDGAAVGIVQVAPELMKAALQDHEALLRTAGETKTWVMTMPAAVLYGRALVEELPTPAVCRVAKEDATAAGLDIWNAFDEAAFHWYASK